MPRRLPQYAAKVGRAALLAVDRVFDTPVGRLLAYVLFAAVAAYVAQTIGDAQRHQCEEDNRLREVELPAAFAQHDRDLGIVLLGEPGDGWEDLSPEDRATIEAFIRTSQTNLRRALPSVDC